MTKVRKLVNTTMTRELIKNTWPASGWGLSFWLSKCPPHILTFLWKGVFFLQGSCSVLCQLKSCEAGTWALVFHAAGDFSYTAIYSGFTLWWHMGCWAAWKGAIPARRLSNEDSGIHLQYRGTAEWRALTPRWTHWLPSHLLSPSCWRDWGGNFLPPVILHHMLLFFCIRLTCSSLLLSSTTRYILWETSCIVLPGLQGNASGDKQPVAAWARKEIFLSESCFIPLGGDVLRGRNMHASAWDSWVLLPASPLGSLGKSILD